MNQRLDIYDIFPSGMTEYLSRYGWHFSKNMCEWAVSRMKAENKATGKKEEIKSPFERRRGGHLDTGGREVGKGQRVRPCICRQYG